MATWSDSAPSSPSAGDSFTYGGTIYTYRVDNTMGVWDAVKGASGGGYTPHAQSELLDGISAQSFDLGVRCVNGRSIIMLTGFEGNRTWPSTFLHCRFRGKPLLHLDQTGNSPTPADSYRFASDNSYVWWREADQKIYFGGLNTEASTYDESFINFLIFP